MDQFFQSECNEDTLTRAYRRPTGDIIITAWCHGLAGRLFLVKEDAEALALAILGLPDRPLSTWAEAPRPAAEAADLMAEAVSA
jgi:hypothetical protein